MRTVWRSGIFLCALSSTQGCRAPSPDWNGTWKLNPTKSSYQGPVMTISILADGDYQFDENTHSALRCDGNEHPAGKNRTRVCVKGVTTLDITLKVNGVKTRTTHDELSTDGKLFTTTVTEFPAKQPVITYQLVFSRLSGSNDFAGRWRDTSDLQQHADMTLRLDNQTLHVDYPISGQYVDAPLNGVEAAVRGPRVLEGSSLTVRAVGSRVFLIVTKRNGKVFNQGSLRLGYDGRVMLHSWWSPDQPAVKNIFFYEKK